MADESKSGKFVLLVDRFDRSDYDPKIPDKLLGYSRFSKGDRLNLTDADAERLLAAGAVATFDKGTLADAQAAASVTTPETAAGNEPVAADPAQQVADQAAQAAAPAAAASPAAS